MHLEKIIFAIDDDTNVHTVAKFMRHVDTQRAMGRMAPMQMLIGCYDGVLEKSYMINASDIDHVNAFIQDQVCVMRVPGDVRQPCCLVYANGETEVLGAMREVSAAEAIRSHKGWTYSIDQGKYFVAEMEG